MTTEYAHDNCLKTSDDLVGSTRLLDPGSSLSSDPYDPVSIEVSLNENDRRSAVDIAGRQPLRACVGIPHQDRPKPPRIKMKGGIELPIAVVPRAF
jgi:hypothetical protein